MDPKWDQLWEIFQTFVPHIFVSRLVETSRNQSASKIRKNAFSYNFAFPIFLSVNFFCLFFLPSLIFFNQESDEVMAPTCVKMRPLFISHTRVTYFLLKQKQKRTEKSYFSRLISRLPPLSDRRSISSAHRLNALIQLRRGWERKLLFEINQFIPDRFKLAVSKYYIHDTLHSTYYLRKFRPNPWRITAVRDWSDFSLINQWDFCMTPG